VVRRGFAAIEFYKAAFGTVEDYRVGVAKTGLRLAGRHNMDYRAWSGAAV